jgi:hypothetical protein
MSTKIKTTTPNTTALTVNLADRLEAMNAEIDHLKAQVARARGTADVTKAAKTAGVRVGGDLSLPLETRIEATLRVKPHNTEELARELHESAGKVSAALRTLKPHLYNAGTEHAPAWFWIVGDDAPTGQVNAAIEALVRFKPMRFPELLAATGARNGRVSGGIVAMQRDPAARLVNLDTPVRARWFVVPEGIQLAKLKKR